MRIEHIAMWVKDLEVMKDFYTKHFEATAGEKYVNQKKAFSSYFLSFEDGCRLEIMQMQGIKENEYSRDLDQGLIHFAVSVGSEESVKSKTIELQEKGYKVVGSPRWTGDGYFESVILDPEGNRVEITI